MKIIHLHSENIKRIKAVDISPEGNTIILSGKNAQGKTSILDSIEIAMRGKAALKGTPEPIRKGQKKAQITLDLGDYVINRRFTDTGNTYLEVVNKEGASFKSPQSLLDKLYSDISFDPLEYLDMDPKKQLSLLMGLVQLDINPTEIDGKIKKAFDDRTEVNREVTRLKSVLASLPEPPGDMEIPDEELSIKDITEQYNQASIQIQENNVLREELNDVKLKFGIAKTDIENTEKEIADAEAHLLHLKSQLSDLIALKQSCADKGKQLTMDVAALQDPDLNKYLEMMSNVEAVNRAVRMKKDREKTILSLDEAERNSEELSTRISSLHESKSEAIKRASFPVPGLGFDDNGVTFNSKPFTQASSAEQLRVSLAMAAALNPELRVIHIRNGSLLDTESMKLVEDFAAQNDLQVWVEKVDESGQIGIYIEDGEVAAVNGKKSKKKEEALEAEGSSVE